MIEINNKTYIEKLSDNNVPITNYGNHTFNDDTYYFDKDSKMFFEKCYKKYKGKTYNFKRIHPHIDNRGSVFICFVSENDKQVQIYMKKLFKSVFGEKHYEVVL